MVETFWFMMTVPAGAPSSRSMRAAASSTAGSHCSHAVIDRSAHRSVISRSPAAAPAGIAPSECEMRWTQPSSDGNSRRHVSRSSVVAMVLPLHEHALRPLGEDLVADLPQGREEALLHAALEQLGRLALERRRARADDAVDQHEVALAPELEELIEVEQRLREMVEAGVALVVLVDVAHPDPATREQRLECG